MYFSAALPDATVRNLYFVSLDGVSLDGAAADLPHRISSKDGLHSVAMPPDARFYVDVFTSTTQPPQVSLHRIDGSLIAYLLENRLDGTHPDAPYLADNSLGQFGTLIAADGQLLHYRLFKPRGFDPARRYPAIVDVYGGPGVQRVVDTWTGSSFTQILTRARLRGIPAGQSRQRLSRHGIPSRPLHRHLGEVEVADQVQGARWLARAKLR